jgi:hypothetical protein
VLLKAARDVEAAGAVNVVPYYLARYLRRSGAGIFEIELLRSVDRADGGSLYIAAPHTP